MQSAKDAPASFLQIRSFIIQYTHNPVFMRVFLRVVALKLYTLQQSILTRKKHTHDLAHLQMLYAFPNSIYVLNMDAVRYIFSSTMQIW